MVVRPSFDVRMSVREWVVVEARGGGAYEARMSVGGRWHWWWGLAVMFGCQRVGGG